MKGIRHLDLNNHDAWKKWCKSRHTSKLVEDASPEVVHDMYTLPCAEDDGYNMHPKLEAYGAHYVLSGGADWRMLRWEIDTMRCVTQYPGWWAVRWV